MQPQLEQATRSAGKRIADPGVVAGVFDDAGDGDRATGPLSARTLSARVAQLRPLYLPPDPSGRTSYEPGEIGQCDFWFPDITVPVGFGHYRTSKQLPVLTMVSGYSRWAAAVLIPSRAAEDLFAGWWQLLDALGAVPRVLVWDGEGAIGRWRQRRPELTVQCHAFRGTLSAKVVVCEPADPQAKGLVERFHDYLERSSCPAGGQLLDDASVHHIYRLRGERIEYMAIGK